MQAIGRLFSSTLAVLILVAPYEGAVAQADDSFQIGGSVRARVESKHRYDFDDARQQYTLTQVRFWANHQVNDTFSYEIEFQDARVFGEDPDGIPRVDPDAVPNIYVDKADLHRAEIHLKAGPALITFGRQKFNLGDKRLVASLEWVNTARVHDALRVRWGEEDARQVDVFLSQLVGVDPNGFNGGDTGSRYFDSQFHGIHVDDVATLTGNRLEYWYYYRRNGDFDDRVNTVGSRLTGQGSAFDFEVQGAFQFGDFDGLKHEAAMARVAVGRQLGQSHLTAGYNYGSGDRDPTDSKHGTFDNLYPLNHAYYGYMDLFALMNLHNLEFLFRHKVGKLTIGADLHGFWLDRASSDAWYNAGQRELRRAVDDVDAFVGAELDLTTSYQLTERMKLDIGYSHFFAGSYVKQTGTSEDADFFFAGLRVAF